MYDNTTVGGLVNEKPGELVACVLHSKERITSVRVHTGINDKENKVIFGLEIITNERRCGLLGREGTNITLVSGHQLLFVSGKSAAWNLKLLDFHFDYGCTSEKVNP